MQFKNPLIPGKFIRRYKRFLADIELECGRVVTAHCTNSGSMESCLEQGAEVYLSPAVDPKRKTPYTWEMIKIANHWIGINTSIPNLLAEEFLRNNLIPGLEDYPQIQREVRYLDSRFDLLVSKPGEYCFIEVKNVTLKVGAQARFPDAVSTRAQKHLQTLMEARRQGYRAVMLYIIQRMDVESFGPAGHIDSTYAHFLEQAQQNGVEIFPVQVAVSPQRIDFQRLLPYQA